jgi:pimeloyl-ACP methyl ester carboxylesterase
MLPRLLSPNADPELVRSARTMIEQNTTEGLDTAIHAMMDRPDSSTDLLRMKVPVLVIAGEEDVFTPPADGARIQGSTERSQLVVLPGAGHLANLEAPEAFSTAVENFLTSAM